MMQVGTRWNLWLAGLGWLVFALFVVAGVPLFLRMPLWCDVTLYDMAARAVMNGGMHYRDVFDTNFPGIVWCQVAVRRVLGPSSEALQAVDLCIVTAILVLLIRLARRAGATSAGVAGLAAAMAAFYLFINPSCHCQRDIWMTLPILIAITLRLHHLDRESGKLRDSILEGIVWGLAVWIKPHVMFIALPVWFVTRSRCLSLRRDLRGQLLGGSLVGTLGMVWLIATGTIEPFLEVFTTWNTSYMRFVWGDTPGMVRRLLFIFDPWSYLHLFGILYAVGDVIRRPTDAATWNRRVFATLYLATLFQSCALQRNFDYVHTPEMFLLFTLLAMHRSILVPAAFVLVFAGPLLDSLCGTMQWPKLRKQVPLHTIFDEKQMNRWPSCFETGLSPAAYRQRQWDVSQLVDIFPMINPVEIGEVADWLRTQDVKDGDVIAWHETPHAVYLELDIRTNFRFMHLVTTFSSNENIQRMTRELRTRALPTAKFIVTDLTHPLRFAKPDKWFGWRETGPNMLSPVFTQQGRATFPYNQPAVFRSGNGHGRYLVHRLEPDIIERLNDGRVQFEFEIDFWK